jgi:hypothetical protein
MTNHYDLNDQLICNLCASFIVATNNEEQQQSLSRLIVMIDQYEAGTRGHIHWIDALIPILIRKLEEDRHVPKA